MNLYFNLWLFTFTFTVFIVVKTYLTINQFLILILLLKTWELNICVWNWLELLKDSSLFRVVLHLLMVMCLVQRSRRHTDKPQNSSDGLNIFPVSKCHVKNKKYPDSCERCCMHSDSSINIHLHNVQAVQRVLTFFKYMLMACLAAVHKGLHTGSGFVGTNINQ